MEFPAPGNSAKLEFLAPLQNIAPQCFVKDLAEFRRARNSGISGPQKFCPGAGIPALGAEFPALKAKFRPSKRHSSR
jgi:hypothetical protein